MSHSSQSLSQTIKLIERSAKPEYMEMIYSELDFYSKNEQKLKLNMNEVCKLINLIGTYLVKAESFNTTESQLIFDTFCDKDFMHLLLTYSNFNFYEINLEIIKTFSFLMTNIKSTTYLYYFFSKNLLNRIINKDYSQYDEEFLSYYINFLKSLSLRLDEHSVHLFYDDKANSFPIIENVIKLYNHRDSMIRNVVRNIVLNVLKIKGVNLQEHFIELPSISYLANLACHLRDMCIKINDEVENKNINNLPYLYDDLIDEVAYIDDLLNLNLDKINYIIINCVFYYFIIPVLCGALGEKSDKISKKVALFLIIFFFLNMKNEIFKNCLFSLLFFEELSQDLDYLFTYPQEKANYSFYPENNKKISFFQYISENYSSKLLLTIIKKDNIIYNKYKDKYPQLGAIMEKCEGMYEKLNQSKNDYSFIDTKEKIEMVLNSFFNEDESNNMSQYHLNLSMSTGLGVGQYSKENTGEIYSICFLCYINPIFVELKGIQKDENSDYLNHKKNVVKEGIEKIMEEEDEDMILLINILFFVVQQKEINISENLLKHVGLENIKEKINVKESLLENVKNLFPNKKKNDTSPLSELSLNNNNFNYNNEFFQIIKDPKNKILNKIKLPLLLSKYFLIYHKDNMNINEEKKLNAFFMPFIYRLIVLNIINLSFKENNSFELKKESNNFTSIINNIENLYKHILQSINSLIKQNEKYRDDGYKIFYKKWQYYHEKFNNKVTLDLIKDEIMNTSYLLLIDDFEKKGEENYFPEISRKYSNNKEHIFENDLFLFMIIHDLREMLLINNGFFKNFSSLNLIKNKFPLHNNEPELNINVEYEFKKIKSLKNFRNIPIFYKFQEKEDFKEGQLIFLNKYAYFVEKINENKLKIKYKFKINTIYLYQDTLNNQENNIIHYLIFEDIFEKNKKKKEKFNIQVKYKDEQIKDEIAKFINDKNFSLNNDERLIFSNYLEEINNSIKNNDEDF